MKRSLLTTIATAGIATFGLAHQDADARKIIMDITLMTHIHIVTLTQLTNKVIIIMNGKVTGAHLKLNKVVNKTLATKQ